jgi:uncharacterized protein YggU (UPF0235/DUF167 family)
MRLTVRVHPRSATPRVAWDGSIADVWVSAPPAEGRANEAVVRMLASWLDVAPSAIRIASGHRGRLKVIEVEGGTLPG